MVSRAKAQVHNQVIRHEVRQLSHVKNIHKETVRLLDTWSSWTGLSFFTFTDGYVNIPSHLSRVQHMPQLGRGTVTQATISGSLDASKNKVLQSE